MRTFAREARVRGVAVAQAAIELKRFLAAAGEDMSAVARKRDRGWFIETFYLEQDDESSEENRPSDRP